MAHPLRHAESSARKFGGTAEDYLPIHNWFDESKAFLPDFRHRLAASCRRYFPGRVPHVVASRWNVDSAITVKFMSSLYDSVLAGKSIPQSVRDAGLQIRSLSGAQRPYYWAAFNSFGSF